MTVNRDEKIVAGIACSQVLARLSDYLDDELEAEARDQVEAHLRGCDGCARFGGEFRATVRALRAELTGSAAGLPASVRARLHAAMDRKP